MSLEQAAIKAQSAFRGYQARQALQALRGIIRLQAVTRGNLVRRQAVATLQSVRGIVKIQALVRGLRVRHSDIGREVHKRWSLGELDAICLGSCKNNGSKRAEKLLRTAFVCKLLSSSPAAMPLQLHYGPEEPNSSWNWLNRWTMLQIGGSHLQSKKTTDSINGSCLTVGTEQVRPKGSVCRLRSSDVEKASIRTSLDSEKVELKLKKVTKDPTKSVHEQPQSGMKKFQRNLKKVSIPMVETSLRSVVDSGRTRQTHSKSTNPDFSEEDSIYPVEKAMEDTGKAISKSSDVETSPELPAEEGAVHGLCNRSDAEVQLKDALAQPKDVVDPLDEDFISRNALISYENKKPSRRRASLPAKHGYPDDGLHNTSRVPSYMASTESAKAKLRGQASPLGQDDAEKNSLTRRHSLPSSTSGKFSSSPRVHRLVQASVKGGIRGERSLMSSRDSCVSDNKVIQAEWKR